MYIPAVNFLLCLKYERNTRLFTLLYSTVAHSRSPLLSCLLWKLAAKRVSGSSEIKIEGEQGAVAADGKTEDISEGLFQCFVVQIGCGEECGRPAASEGREVQSFLRDTPQTADCCVFVPGVKGTGEEAGNEVKCWN